MDSGPRQLEDMRRLFEAGCEAARNDLERIEHMLARMDRIEAMLGADSEGAAAHGAVATLPPDRVGAQSPAEGRETQSRAEGPETQARQTGRASLRDSPLAHLFRPTD